MINEDFLKSKYDEKECKHILFVRDELKTKINDNTLLSVAEEIAEIVVGLKLDENSVCASMIFPYVLSEKVKIEDYNQQAEIQELLSKLKTCDELSKSYTDADGLKEMLIAITKDIRIIIIKIAEVLVFARKNVLNTQNESVKIVFKSIDDIFAPIAARLGLSEVKSELQDLSFKFNDPERYNMLEEEVTRETRANSEMINEIVSDIKHLLKGNGIEPVCYGRIKHLSSINNKINSKNLTVKNIYDIAAVRIIVNSVSECYTALGMVHSSYVPVDGRFKDYIAHPKPNGYQSLHTTVYYKDEFFEVQIRTFKMHDFAEYGVAAHFLYKEHKKNLAGIDNKLLWIRKLIENKEEVSSSKLLEELKTDVYLGEIFVCSPKGKVVKLVENSTPLDFAYMIHSDIGNSCVGAKVNGQMVPLTSTLHNGDVIEILTSVNSKGPSRDWLKHVKTQQARDKINMFFKKQMKEENIKLGKSMLEQYAKSNNISLASIMQEKYVNEMLRKNAFVTIDEVYASIGYGSLTAEKVANRLITIKAQDDSKNKNILFDARKSPVKIETKTDIIGAEGTLTKYCKCCNPIPGDEITGYVSRGRGIIIHRKDCVSIKNLPENRFIHVDWNASKEEDYMFSSIVEVVAKSTNTIYNEITNALSELGIRVVSFNTSTNKNEELILKIGIMVKDRNQLQQVKNKLGSLASVYEVV